MKSVLLRNLVLLIIVMFLLRDYWMVVDLFCFCDLDSDLMIFIYEFHLYCLEIHRMCKYELPTSRLSKVIV